MLRDFTLREQYYRTKLPTLIQPRGWFQTEYSVRAYIPRMNDRGFTYSPGNRVNFQHLENKITFLTGSVVADWVVGQISNCDEAIASFPVFRNIQAILEGF